MTFKISPNPERVHYFINLEGGEGGSGQLTEAARIPSTSLKVLLLLTQRFSPDRGLPSRARHFTHILIGTDWESPRNKPSC